MSLSAASTSSELSEEEKAAACISDGYVRMSVGIESSGQCTALRHVVASSEHVSEASVKEALAAVPLSDSPYHCLDKGDMHARLATLACCCLAIVAAYLRSYITTLSRSMDFAHRHI
jgi:hypothetical protein